jgi:phosphatidate cytidylyltransferase
MADELSSAGSARRGPVRGADGLGATAALAREPRSSRWHSLRRADFSSLHLRVLSGVALAPLPIAAIWFGSPWLPLLTAFAAAVMAWEWGRLCRRGRFGGTGIVLVGVVLAVVATAALLATRLAVGLALVGAVGLFWTARKRPGLEAEWTAVGALWIALPCVSLLWLAGEGTTGRATLLWVLAVVWATDIGAYATGRTLGGPRLAPRWSPQKTWAGLAGGTVCAALVGWVTAAWLGISPALPLISISAGLAIVEQFGDLAESLAKRRFGVKDTSSLIPGHGGLFDRLDGLLAVIPVVALLTLIDGRSILAWR